MFKQLIKRVLGGDDAAVAAAAATSAEAQRLLRAYVKEAARIENPWAVSFQQLPTARAIADVDPQTKVRLLALVARGLKDSTTPRITNLNDKRVPVATALQDLLSALVRPRLPIDEVTLDALIQCAATRTVFAVVPAAGIIRAVEHYAQTQPLSESHRGHLGKLKSRLALCGARGWSYHLQGSFDSDNTPTRVLRRQRMRVEFWVESVETDPAATSDAGIFLHVSTDQVRFYNGESEQQPMPLADVPPTIFSELMRDVDLFVGVCSVGNDPTWRDRGEQFGAYWQGFTFGELGESAKTRRDVLSRLIPRLKFADRATLEDRFLVIRGDLRTYKIHLGSSNIQMEPNNQYLCIVPDRRAPGEDVFLPFEGDHTLSVILSKAFLLADDRNIKDPSIVSQIRV